MALYVSFFLFQFHFYWSYLFSVPGWLWRSFVGVNWRKLLGADRHSQQRLWLWSRERSWLLHQHLFRQRLDRKHSVLKLELLHVEPDDAVWHKGKKRFHAAVILEKEFGNDALLRLNRNVFGPVENLWSPITGEISFCCSSCQL